MNCAHGVVIILSFHNNEQNQGWQHERDIWATGVISRSVLRRDDLSEVKWKDGKWRIIEQILYSFN